MTRSYRGRSRSRNGSIVIRSQSKVCRAPPTPSTGPSRSKISSNATGQSSSVPSSNPMMCLVAVNEWLPSSAESRHVMGELGPPGRPVVRDVVSPQIGFVLDALGGQQPGQLLRALQRACGVFPLALPADQQQADVVA